MLEEISSRDLAEWMAFFTLEPFGYQAGLSGHAITSSVVANANRRKGARPFKPADFLPKEKEEQAASDFIGGLKQYFVAAQSKDERRKKKDKHDNRTGTARKTRN